MERRIDSVVFSPSGLHGGVKSLYSLTEWLNTLGRSTIVPCLEPGLASWFDHTCQLYDHSYFPQVIIYPEVFQPTCDTDAFRICFALGQRGHVAPDTDLVVCRSPEVLNWLRRDLPDVPAVVIRPSIKRPVFEYDGRPKKDMICYMTRPTKHPETAALLRERYDEKVVEIVNCTEAMVAEILKDAKVFVWRGDEKEGSPRPPKEALVAGCTVVGLKSDLDDRYATGFGVRCSTVDDLIEMAGKALDMPMPTAQERSVVRDSAQEQEDWFRILTSLNLGQTLS